MFIDSELVLGSAQTVTASAATTNSVDQKAAGSALPSGIIPIMQFLINTTVAATGGASTTTFSIQDSADNTTFADIARSADIAKATLVAGYVVALMIPPGARRYLAGYYTISTNNWTSGKVDCRIVLAQDVTLDKIL